MKSRKRGNKNPKFTGALVLGMHDALVSQTGIIAGLAFSMADARLIILTSIVSAIVAGFSMGAASYLAHRADGRPDALASGLCTGGIYMLTSGLLIAPFGIFANRIHAFIGTVVVAVGIIAIFNFCIARIKRAPFMPRFLEMLWICAGVSIIAFLIGMMAKHFLGIAV